MIRKGAAVEGGGARQTGSRIGRPAARSGVRTERPASRETAAYREADERGLKLAAKFSLSIIGTLAVVLAIFAVLVSRQSLSLLEEEVDRRGVSLVGALLQHPAAFWEEQQSLAHEYQSPHLKALVEDPTIRGQILCVLVQNDHGLQVGSAEGDSYKIEPAGGEMSVAGVKASDCAYTGGGFTAVAAREFKGARREGGGMIRLVLRADRIAQARKRLVQTVVLAVGVSVAFGGGLAVMLAGLVTRPIHQLVNDMRVVSQGRLDHRTTATSRDEIGLLARTFNRMTQELRHAHDAEIERRATERDLELGRDIQASLLPQRVPQLPGFDLAPFYRSAREVGGDYYDFIPIDREHLGIAVADVSGKGVQGSLVMTMTRSVLRSFAPASLSTKETMSLANATIARDLRPGSFVTVLYMILDVARRELLVSSAGHNPLVLVRQGKVHKINPSGIAVGFDKGPLFNSTIAEQRVALQPGDLVMAYTDGVVEAMNADRQEYGNERFFRYCSANAGRPAAQIVEGLVKELDAHKGDAPQHDDITIVSLRVP